MYIGHVDNVALISGLLFLFVVPVWAIAGIPRTLPARLLAGLGTVVAVAAWLGVMLWLAL